MGADHKIPYRCAHRAHYSEAYPNQWHALADENPHPFPHNSETNDANANNGKADEKANQVPHEEAH
jgi:hypothetical protein